MTLACIDNHSDRRPTRMLCRHVAIALVASLALALPGAARAQISTLSDEFDDAATIDNWLRINEVEGWDADQLELWDVNASRPGWMRMMPHTSSWFANWRGVLAFKLVSGDFAITTRVATTNRAGDAAPGELYSLAGIMIREPREITDPDTEWTQGGENYVFLSHGAADTPGTYQHEVKTTEDSDSTLRIAPAPTSVTEIRSVRIGAAMLMLRRPEGGQWVVHERYRRDTWADIGTLQAGLTCYTDWNNVQPVDPFVHNSSPGVAGNPDLIADFDFVRYTTVTVPESLEGRDLTEPGEVSDLELLAFLGNALDPVEVDGDGMMVR